MARFDVCYLGWRKHLLYEFGIGSNKLPDYLYSGKPIIHSYSGKGDLVKLANAGISIEAAYSIVKAILELHSIKSSERCKLGDNGENFANENMNYLELAKKLNDFII